MDWTYEEMDRLFHPRTVAVVGDTRRNNHYMWIRAQQTLRGRLVSVQIDEEEARAIQAMGIPNYPSLLDIPGPVDYVIVSVPRRVAPQILRDAIRKGVEGVMFFTAGFAETGEEEGVRLQEELRRLALSARMKVVGPNCMGIFNPAVGLRQSPEQYAGEPGPVAFISQSGTHAIFFSLVGERHGIRISKSVSMGNGIVLHAEDYLRYFAQDPATRAVALYLEGVPDGRRFLQALREAARRKPVVVWKGGVSEEGARAVRSHTASLTTSPDLWRAALRQAGALQADTFGELLDLLKALLRMRPLRGPRMGLVAMTGGQSVVFTDAFVRAGLQVPALAPETYAEFATFYSTVGGSYRNPLDMTPTARHLDAVRRALTLLAHDPNIDGVVVEVSVPFLGRLTGPPDAYFDLLAEMQESLPVPLACVLTAAHREEEALEVREELVRRGLPVFATFHECAAALRKALDRWREGPYSQVTE